MKDEENYKEVNRRTWNEKVAHHMNSDFYDQRSFMAGEDSLKSIEIDLLGDLKGKRILHLQCHFGQDSISMARRGASVTAIDLSDEAIKQARSLSE